MNHSSRDYQNMLNLFPADAPEVGLEKIKNLVEAAKEENLLSRFVLIILFPGALLISLGICIIFRFQKNIASFKNSVQWSPILILLATFAYILMWWHLVPILWSCVKLLYLDRSWQEFFVSLFRWNTLNALIAIVLNVPFSLMALESFKLIQTFEDRYESLRLHAQTIYQSPIEWVNLRNEIIRIAPEILQNKINQTIQAMMVRGDFDEETVQQVTEAITKITWTTYQEIVDNAVFNLETETDSKQILPDDDHFLEGDK